MSTLAILLPPRERLAAPGGNEAGAGLRVPDEYPFVFSADGSTLTHQGRAAPALLPKADRTVLVLSDTDVAWHKIKVPRAPAARLRAALAGILEDEVLDDEASTHLALAPGAHAGRNGWVAVTHRRWLVAVLAALEGAGHEVEKVSPSSAPVAQPMGHFFAEDGADESRINLVLARREGVSCVKLAGVLARALAQAAGENARWTATPAAAAAAERWLGSRVSVLTEAERALAASRTATNLRQFDLAPHHRGLRAVRAAWRTFLAPEWRAVRYGLVGLVAVQLIGLNAYAWRQERTLADKRAAMAETLRTTFPGVRAVLDPPLQMQRETDRARALAGRAGEADFEALLGAAAAAWPDGAAAAPTIRFEPGRLTLAAAGWSEAQVRQFRDRLQAGGLAAEFAEGRVVVSRVLRASGG